MVNKRYSILIAALPLTMLSACAGFSNDGGMSGVRDALRLDATEIAKLQSPADAQAAQTLIDALLQGKLTQDAAVQIALLNNRNLQAAYNALGIAEADRVAANLPPNPVLSFAKLAGGGEVEVETGIGTDLLGLLTLPARGRAADLAFKADQLEAAEATLALALQTRIAWTRAVSAREIAAEEARALEATRLAGRFTVSLVETGALGRSDEAASRIAVTESEVAYERARADEVMQRERLVALLGLWGPQADSLNLPASLGSLPKEARDATTLEQDAIASRLDLERARLVLQQLDQSYGLTAATQFIDSAEGAALAKRVDGDDATHSHERGFDLAVSVPLFDLGGTRQRRAQEKYLQAANLLAAKAVDIRSETRNAWTAYRSALSIARKYRNGLVPQLGIVSEETLLSYNAMQVDVYALLSDVRRGTQARIAAKRTKADFWIADANLGAVTQIPTNPTGPSDQGEPTNDEEQGHD